jgi:hypothetical protein
MKLSSVIPGADLATAPIGLWAQAPQQGQVGQDQAQAHGRGGRGTDAGFWAGKKKLLIVADVSTGFHHHSFSHALATVERLGREPGAYMTMIRTDPQLITKDQLVGQGSRYAGRGVERQAAGFLRRGLPSARRHRNLNR